MPSIFFLSLMNGAAWGGSEELWYKTALYAAGKGHKVACAFYNWKEKEPKIEALKKAGCRVYLLPNKGRNKTNLWERIQYKFSKWKSTQIVSALPFSQYDLTIVNLGGFEIYTSTWKDAFRKLSSYVLLFHNYSEEELYSSAKAKRLRQWISHASGNLFAARRIKGMLEEKLGIEIPNPDVVINPINIQRPTSPAPYPQKPFTFVMLAELDVNRKAQDNIVKAFSSKKWMEREWQLFLYGKGRDHDMLHQLIIKSNLTNKIQLKGHVADVRPVLENAHLVLQLTHLDAMPLAVMEAMAIGRPVVVSKIGDMPYWIEDGRNGWVSTNSSVEQIDAVMERAWQQKEQWAEMAKYSFDIFTEKFPPSPEERFLQQLQQILIKEGIGISSASHLNK